jgi:hypothetical protein
LWGTHDRQANAPCAIDHLAELRRNAATRDGYLTVRRQLNGTPIGVRGDRNLRSSINAARQYVKTVSLAL